MVMEMLVSNLGKGALSELTCALTWSLGTAVFK